MTLNEHIKQSYVEMLDSNNLTEEQFKDMFKDKNPILKFTVQSDFVKVYIGDKNAKDDCSIVEIARLKPIDVLTGRAFRRFETLQIVLCTIYAMNVLVGYKNNPIRNIEFSEALDLNLNSLIINEIRKHKSLYAKLKKELYFARYKRIKLDLETPNIPKYIIGGFDLFDAFFKDWFYIIKESDFIVLCKITAFEDFAASDKNFLIGDVISNLSEGNLNDLYKLVKDTQTCTVLIMDKYRGF